LASFFLELCFSIPPGLALYFILDVSKLAFVLFKTGESLISTLVEERDLLVLLLDLGTDSLPGGQGDVGRLLVGSNSELKHGDKSGKGTERIFLRMTIFHEDSAFLRKETTGHVSRKVLDRSEGKGGEG
jgi:hypothetical protein